jgi:hypothetical protein
MAFPANAVVCLSDDQVVNDEMRMDAWSDAIICGVSEPLSTSPAPSKLPRSNLRVRLRRIFLRILLIIVGTLVLADGLDFAIFEIRVMAKLNPYGTVTVNPYDAVLQKNGKTSFIFNPSQPQTCVNALFPHAGALPCWYLSRHPDRRTDI